MASRWFNKKKDERPLQSAFERRVIPGIPSAFSGRDTTMGEMRHMATLMYEKDWQTSTEKGLAKSLLAVLDLYEQEVSDG